MFRDNRMIAVCQNVPLSAEDKLLLRHQLRRHEILTKVFPNQVLKPFLEQSKYQSLLPLFVGHNMLLVSQEPKVKEMVRILKSVPFLPLLGGCVDDTILSRQGFVNYSKLPSLALLQGQLVGGLAPPHGPDPPPAAAAACAGDGPSGSVRQTATRWRLRRVCQWEAGPSWPCSRLLAGPVYPALPTQTLCPTWLCRGLEELGVGSGICDSAAADSSVLWRGPCWRQRAPERRLWDAVTGRPFPGLGLGRSKGSFQLSRPRRRS